MNNYFKISKFFLYLVPLAIVIVTPSTLFPFIVGKYVFFRIAVGLALIFFLLGLAFQSKTFKLLNLETFKLLFKSPLAIAASAFVLIFVLAGFFGVDPAFSFWSNFERGEGGLQMLYLGAFFLLTVLLFSAKGGSVSGEKNEKDWQKMFLVSILAASLMIFYGIGAGLKYLDAETVIRDIDGVPQKVLTGKGGPLYQTFKSFVGPDFREDGYRFAGSIGNPAYVSVYLIFVLFYVFYLLFNRYKQRMKSFGAVSLLVLAVFFSVFFFLSATRGAFIGLIAAILTVFLYAGFSIKAWRKWLLGSGVIMLLFVGLLVCFRDVSFIKSIPGSRIFDISFKTENFQNRMVIWKIAIDGFRERPILGWGPENFSYTFDKHYNPKHYSITAGFGAWYDRAHNIFLDYLNQAGILGLLSFLGVFAAFYWQFFRWARINAEKKFLEADKRGKEKNQLPITNNQLLITNALLFSIPIAYLIQGIVLFDILPTYINLFLFLGFASYKFSKQSLSLRAKGEAISKIATG